MALTAADLARRYRCHRPGLQDARHNFAVLVPLVETREGLCLLYEVRAGGIAQGGEVCFPGGRMEPGETPVEAALRETCEELAIPPGDITVLGELDFLHLRREGLMYPVLAALAPEALEKMRPAPAEVAETFLVPLAWLRAHPPAVYRYPLRPMVGDDFPYGAVQVSADYPWLDGHMEVPVYTGLPHPLWGLSARITRHLIEDTADLDRP